MAGGAKLFLFILFLPFLAALGHDIHLAYFSDDEKIQQLENLNIDTSSFRISDLGWVWTNRSPDSYEWARQNFSIDTWQNILDPILQLPTMIVALIPFVVGTLILMLMFVMGIGPYKGMSGGSAKGEYSVFKGEKANKLKYSKK